MSLGVLLVDDEPLIRSGLRAIIDAELDLEVLGEAEDGAAVASLVRRVRPAVVLMDVRMPGVDGIEATRRLLAQVDDPARVLVLTTFENDDYVFDALRAGASGFLLKRARPEEVSRAIRLLAAGDSLLFPSAIRDLAARRARGSGRRPRRRRAHRPGGRDPAPRRPGPLQRGDRRAALRELRDRQDPRRSRAHQARRPRPDPGGHPCLRRRVRQPGVTGGAAPPAGRPTSPSRRNATTAATRRWTCGSAVSPSFPKIALTCFSIAEADRNSASPIPELLFPGVRPALGPAAGGLPRGYAVVCFLTDRKGGKQHLEKGQITEVTVG